MEPERVPSESERASLRELVLRAGKHEPLQYLVGMWPFRGKDYELGRSTLIPRPATETLVERAVDWYRRSMSGQPLRMADIGTGTGIIAISIMSEIRSALRLTGCKPLAGQREVTEGALPEIQLADRTHDVAAASAPFAQLSLRCLATDVVADAVALAKRNVARHGLSAAIDVRQGSLFEPFRNSKPGSFDLLCSNPPYVSDVEWTKVEPNVRDYEPESALRAGPDGLAVIRPLVAGAPHWLRSGGLLLVEIGYEQGSAALDLVAERSHWTSAEILKDFEGHPRVLSALRA
jgi:release factor glutamine methyltransferase